MLKNDSENHNFNIAVVLQQLSSYLRTALFVPVLESWYNYKDEIYPKEGEIQSYAKSTNATTDKRCDDGHSIYRAASHFSLRTCFKYSKYVSFGIANCMVQCEISLESFCAFRSSLPDTSFYHWWPFFITVSLNPRSTRIGNRYFDLLQEE